MRGFHSIPPPPPTQLLPSFFEAKELLRQFNWSHYDWRRVYSFSLTTVSPPSQPFLSLSLSQSPHSSIFSILATPTLTHVRRNRQSKAKAKALMVVLLTLSHWTGISTNLQRIDSAHVPKERERERESLYSPYTIHLQTSSARVNPNGIKTIYKR